MIGNSQVFQGGRGGRGRIPFLVAILAATTGVSTVTVYFATSRAGKSLLDAFETRVLAQEPPPMLRKIHLENSGPPLSPEQISEFEKELGGRLPDDYKRFLLAHNGGLCEPLLGLPWSGQIEKVGGFYPLLAAAEDSGIRYSLRRLRALNRVKVEGYVPIARTYSEGQICLAYRGDHAGAAFYTAYKYKIAYIDDLIPIDVTMVPLADSFTDLLNYMVVIPNPYCRVEDLGKRGTADDLARYLAEGKSINAVGKHGMTILCEAIKFNNSAMIGACIKRGASLSGSIEIAVRNRRIHLIEMLVKAGANVNERDKAGWTPLHYVPGRSLPGEDGVRARALWDLLIRLGAVE